MHVRGSSIKENINLNNILFVFLIHEDSLYKYSSINECKDGEYHNDENENHFNFVKISHISSK